MPMLAKLSMHIAFELVRNAIKISTKLLVESIHSSSSIFVAQIMIQSVFTKITKYIYTQLTEDN